MNQKQKTKTPSKKENVSQRAAKNVKDEELAESTDELIDAIDDVLEEDCETFVKNYVQRGGQ